jgi:hypothetical protein
MRLILTLFLLSCTNLNSQETIDVKFNEANPIWVHTMVDTTFIPIANQAFFTKFSSISPHLAQREKDFIYPMAICKEKQSLDDYGFILDKIDIRTGNKIWTHYNTPYNQGQKDVYHNLNFFGDNIEMVGAVENFDRKNYCSHKMIDTKTGQLIKFTNSSKSLPEFYTRYFTGYVISSDSLLLNSFTVGDDIGSLDKPKYNYGINVELYDKNMLNLIETRNLFDFDTLGPFSIDQPNYTLKLNQNTLVSLAYRDRYESWSNRGTKIMWTDISDPFKIKTRQIKDYTGIIPGTKESFLLQRFNAINNTIHISHNYPNFDIQKNTCYILWLDSIGEIKTFIPIPKYNDHLYLLTDMIYANDDFAYLYASPSIKDKYGFDIIRINHGIDTIQYISSLTSLVEGESFAKNFNIHTLYDDGFLILGGYATKEGQESKTALKIYCFRALDLGIDFKPVSTNEIIKENHKFSIFPNPTSNSLYLKLSDLTSNSRMRIYDLNGKQVFEESLPQIFNQIEISSLTKGVYFVRVTNDKGEVIGKTEKIVKVE